MKHSYDTFYKSTIYKNGHPKRMVQNIQIILMWQSCRCGLLDRHRYVGQHALCLFAKVKAHPHVYSEYPKKVSRL